MTQRQRRNVYLLPPLGFFNSSHSLNATAIMPDTPPTNIPLPSKTPAINTPPRSPKPRNEPSIEHLEEQAWAWRKEIDYAYACGENVSQYKGELKRVEKEIRERERDIRMNEREIKKNKKDWEREKELWEREMEKEKEGEDSKGKDGTGKRWWRRG